MPREQKEFPAVPKTELGRECEKWVKTYDDMNQVKELLDKSGEKIVDLLNKEGRTAVSINANGEFHRFEVNRVDKIKLKHSKVVGI